MFLDSKRANVRAGLRGVYLYELRMQVAPVHSVEGTSCAGRNGLAETNLREFKVLFPGPCRGYELRSFRAHL